MVSHLPYRIDPAINRHHFFEQHWKACARNLLRSHTRPPGTLLDWGCGRGESLPIFAADGWKVRGADPDPECAKLSRDLGFEVDLVKSESPADTYGQESFDVVLCLHVLEHVDCPKRVLQGLAAISKKYVLLGVPNARTLQEPFSRKVELAKVNEGHLQIWDHAHLLNLAERHCGLRLKSWGFDATILPFFARLAMMPAFRPWLIRLETGLFRTLFPFHGITCLGLFEKRGNGRISRQASHPVSRGGQ